MRSEKNRKKEIKEREVRQKKVFNSIFTKPPLNIILKVWAVVYVFILAGFVGMIAYADMLPATYLYVALTILGVLTLIIFPTIYFRNIKASRKVVALVLSVLLAGTAIFGMTKLGDTLAFFSKVSSVGTQTEDYYVVVKSDSDYRKVEELAGKKVGTYLSTERNYSTAKGRLLEKVKVDYVLVRTLSKMDNGLLAEKPKYEAIFISTAQYDTLCEKEESFKTDSRILYTMKIDINTQNTSKRVDITKESFNVYISGLDTSGEITETSRSDVNMIVTVNPRTHTVLLTSIPRDYQIQLPSYDGAYDKLTHTGIYGVSETTGAVETLTGLDMNYYLKVNYSTVKKFVDAIGGVSVKSDYEFDTHGQAAQYHFVQGENKLDGKMALAFARERKSFEDGDVQRNRNQEKVMKAIIKKLTSSTTILTRYTKILKSCEKYMEVNMDSKQIRQLVKFQMKGGYKWKVYTQSLKGAGMYSTCYSSGDYQVYVMQPDPELVVKAVDQIIAVQDGSKH